MKSSVCKATACFYICLILGHQTVAVASMPRPPQSTSQGVTASTPQGAELNVTNERIPTTGSDENSSGGRQEAWGQNKSNGTRKHVDEDVVWMHLSRAANHTSETLQATKVAEAMLQDALHDPNTTNIAAAAKATDEAADLINSARHDVERAMLHSQARVSATPWNIFAATGTLVGLTGFWFAYFTLLTWSGVSHDPLNRMGCLDNTMRVEYEELPDESYWVPPLVFLSAVSYWIAMPGVNVGLGFLSTCEGGPPNFAYYIYSGFFALHMGIAATLSKSLGRPNFFADSVMSSLPVLSTLMLLEHFDMATDALFPGSAEACNAEIIDVWLESWLQLPLVGPFFAACFSRMHFAGVAWVTFIIGAYLPQLLGLWSFFAVAFTVLTFLMVLAWVNFDWYIGLPIMLLSYVCFHVSGLATEQWNLLNHMRLKSSREMAVWAGMLLFDFGENDESEIDKHVKAFLFGLTRIILENLLQLWLQASLFAASFHVTDQQAKVKAILSIGLGLAVATIRLLQLFPAWVRLNDWDDFGRVFTDIRRFFTFQMDLLEILVFAVPPATIVCALLLVAWVAAKVTMAFLCEDHMWNLFSGCVTM